jgi:hypothetical protein
MQPGTTIGPRIHPTSNRNQTVTSEYAPQTSAEVGPNRLRPGFRSFGALYPTIRRAPLAPFDGMPRLRATDSSPNGRDLARNAVI